MSTSAPPLSLILGGCPISFQFYLLVFLYKSLSPAFSSPPALPLLPPAPPALPCPATPRGACQSLFSSRSSSLKVLWSCAQLHASACVSCRWMRFFVISVFLTRLKTEKKKKKRNLLLQVFFSLHVSLSEVCAFYSKENIFYILLTVDFFVVNIFCIFIYKSHKKNSNVQLYTLNLQLEENKVNSVVSGLQCPLFSRALSSPTPGWGTRWGN